MAHPLDEVYPVAVNHNTLHLMEDPMIQIIYANENPSICMLHDKSNGQHSVYRIRKIKYEEWLETCEKSYRSGVSLPNKVNYILLCYTFKVSSLISVKKLQFFYGFS